MWGKQRLAAIAASLGAVVALAVSGGGVALGEEPVPDGTTAQIGRASQVESRIPGIDLNAGVPVSVHSVLSKYLEQHSLTGLNAIQWDAGAQAIRLHYHGSAPTDLAANLESSTGTRVILVSDLFDRDALAIAAGKIARQITTASGSRITSAGPSPDSSRIEVTVAGDSRLKQSFSTDAQSLAANLGIDVPISIIAAGEVQPSSRQGDAPPWSGGARMSTPTSQAGVFTICTTGWGMGIISSLPNYRAVMLTADHCSGGGAIGVPWRTGIGSTTTLIGSTESTPNSGADLQLINIVNQTQGGSGFIYVGDYQSEVGARVRGAIPPIIGDSWCDSGASSGTVCGNEVVNTELTVCYSLTECYGHTVKTQQTAGISSEGNGDSGGPVGYLYVDDDGYLAIYAAGVISGIMDGSPSGCQGLPGQAGDRECSDINLVAPIQVLFDVYPDPIGILTY
jgi:hypothetical protein